MPTLQRDRAFAEPAARANNGPSASVAPSAGGIFAPA
jgi:hypothetical protein